MSAKFTKLGIVLLILLVLNSAYLLAFTSASIPYIANVLLHIVLGVVLIPFAAVVMWKSRASLVPGIPFALAAVIGVYLMVHGNLRADHPVLAAHIAVAVIAVALCLPALARYSKPLYRGLAGAMALGASMVAVMAAYHHYYPNPHDRIVNPDVVPASMEEEGGGPKSPFWPSSIQTNVHKQIPANFFLDSEKCGECHKQIYDQWKHSAHHFASFNNQFYRKSIEYMQDVQHSTKPSQWCAGCHDHAVIFSGRWAQPIKNQIDTPQAQAGLGCISCHAISRVDSSMGNGGYVMEYNPLHDLAVSTNPYVHALDRFLTYVNPEPHRRTFLKPFMAKDTSEFCSTCHKVHLDIPVNSYRWVRGFNDYDNWQASGVSGQGARSFYYPNKPAGCADCHMPQQKSREPGNVNGLTHSHYFAAANTAVPIANNDPEQLKRVEDFLKSGFMRVDIFAASPVEDSGALQMKRSAGNEGPLLASTFAVGEESDQHGAVFLRDVSKVAAPVERGNRVFARGSTVRVDVVVRTLKIGHFFPGGTVDAQEAWLELQGKDATGRLIFWSGNTERAGGGAVDPGAHFYQSIQLDGDANVISRRNAFQTRSLLYVRLIPPGAADVAHYRVRIPKDAVSPITLTARLNYRKFTDYYTKYVYAGEPKPGQDPALVDIHHDSREWTFDPKNIPANVSGAIKGRIPDLPIVTIASATSELGIGGKPTDWTPVVDKKDRDRWNDYGIGLLLQGDLKGAEYAFTKVTEADAAYSDGYLNVARALIQEGEMERAKPFVMKAIALNPKAARNYYFLALAQKTDGDYDGALRSLETAASYYPRDRVVLNQIARIQFLKKDYRSAVASLHRVLMVDPEDVQCHYNLMLCLRALGETEEAQREETLFRRFKADEASQSITGKIRQLSPEMNNSRQAIHDHESAPLGPVKAEVTSRHTALKKAAVPAGL